MGNSLSQNKSNLSLELAVDNIASYYINNPSIGDMTKLSDPQHCGNLVILTSKIIDQYLDNSTIQYLVEKKGISVNNYKPNDKTKIMAINKIDFDKLDIQNPHKKQGMCIGLAKHYVQIASLFAAINNTVNPIVEKSEVHEPIHEAEPIHEPMQEAEPVHEAEQIPEPMQEAEPMPESVPESVPESDSEPGEEPGEEPREEPREEPGREEPREDEAEPREGEQEGGEITSKDLCANRVANLLNNQSIEDLEAQIAAGKPITIQPKFCSINCNSCPEVKNLSNEPGIPELEHLYYDKYDYVAGKFNKMSNEMEKQYKKDVANFYLAFTDKNIVPESIQKFSDIKLRDYFNSVDCKSNNYNSGFQGPMSHSYMRNYVINIRNMIADTKKYHDLLLGILQKLFIFGFNPATKEKKIIINSKLTDPMLVDYTSQTTNIINDLYKSCEAHYVKGIKLYKKIVETQKFRTSRSAIQILENDEESMREEPREAEEATEEPREEQREEPREAEAIESPREAEAPEIADSSNQ